MNLSLGTRYLTAFLALMLAWQSIPAAQAVPHELWSKPVGVVSDPAWAMQIFADGTGGAAAVYANGNVPKPEGGFEPLRYTVVWFNAAGRELFRKTFEVADDDQGASSILMVVGANKNALLVQFYLQIGADPATTKTIVASRNGKEAEVEDVSTVEGLTGGALAPVNRYSDATSFFGFRISADNTVSLVKHSLQ